MHHPIYKVTSLKVVGSYKLELTFNDGVQKTIDFEPVLHGEMFSPLKDLSLFNRVAIDPEVKTIVWPNGADFDPAILHNWEEYADEIIRRSQEWELVEN